MNISLILSGGVGNRFGADIPKQYCLLKGRPVIEYAIDACRLSKKTDKTIIVAAGKYVKELYKKYGFETVEGGKERNNSVKNGLDYIAENYCCEKIVMIDAVSPLTTEEQIDRYYDLLDTYDIIQTAQKVITSLDKYNGDKVMRNDYYHTLEPEAYNFKMLYEYFDGNNPSTTVYHQMPQKAKKYACFDYPYNMKLTYPFDMRIAEVLLDEVIIKQKEEKTKQKTKLWLSSVDKIATEKWMTDVWDWFASLQKRWQIVSYHINPQSFTGLVIEGYSNEFGDIIVKFDAPMLDRYYGECFYYRHVGRDFMAELLDYDDEYSAMLIRKIYPGVQTKFDPQDVRLRKFYDLVFNSFIQVSPNDYPKLKTIMSNFEMYATKARTHNFENLFRFKLENVARLLWEKYFSNSPKVLLHMDLHRRNILDNGDEYKAIDCQGVIGPYEFEFTRMFIIDNKDNRENTISTCKKMFNFCLNYCTKERLNAAIFIEWVFLMNEFVFADSDNYQAASWAIKTIKALFYSHDQWEEDVPIPELID